MEGKTETLHRGIHHYTGVSKLFSKCIVFLDEGTSAISALHVLNSKHKFPNADSCCKYVLFASYVSKYESQSSCSETCYNWKDTLLLRFKYSGVLWCVCVCARVWFCCVVFLDFKKFLAFMYLNGVFGNVKVKMILPTWITDEISLVNYLLTVWSIDENVQGILLC